MKTSYFKGYAGPGRISVARSARGAAKGFRIYSKLAPGPWFNKCKTTDSYIDLYVDEVLDKLDAQNVWDELHALAAPYEPVLMCHEPPGYFCHRQVIALWFELELGKKVYEIGEEEENK